MHKATSQEHPARSANGFTYILIGLAGLVLAALLARAASGGGMALLILFAGLLVPCWCWGGLYVLQPNQAALLMFFGSYRGTDRNEGLRWANPFNTKTKISVRARNFNSEKLKVNDLRGNPIEIAAAIVWRVEDTARASFDVQDFDAYVLTQAEAAVRHLASRYAYANLDDAEGEPAAREVTLRSGTDEVGAALRHELQERFAQAGIVVVDAKLTHLAYAPEIAGAMLRRQQAEAVIAARQKLVDGAVGMVEMALTQLQHKGVINLDEERKAAMVSNLLVVLCSEHDATPVINTGTLHN